MSIHTDFSGRSSSESKFLGGCGRPLAICVLATQAAVLMVWALSVSPAAAVDVSALAAAATASPDTATTDSTLFRPDGSVIAAEPDIAAPAFELPGPGSPILRVAISPDGRLIAYATVEALYLTGIPATRAYLVKEPYTGKECTEWSIAFDPHSELMAGCANGMPVSVWDKLGRRRWSEVDAIRDIEDRANMLKAISAIDTSLEWLQFSADGKRLYAPVPEGGPGLRDKGTGPEGKLLMWDAGTGRRGQMPAADNNLVFSQMHLFRSRRSSSSQLNLRLAQGRRLHVRLGGIDSITADKSGGQVFHSLKGHAAAVRNIAVSPQGAFLIAADETGLAIVWDLRSYERVAVFQSQKATITAVDVDDTGTWAAAGDEKGNVMAWNLRQKTRPAAR